ncbi:MAG: hypothetical protein HY791_32175 [Deltaproteobacteria bacterium]|nr:hypothetical protein [Deltaproteobacteria bacterium]
MPIQFRFTVLWLSVWCGACGGPARFAQLSDVSQPLSEQFGEDPKVNAFYCKDPKPCVPEREEFRVSWPVVCGGPTDPCDQVNKKYQEVFDGAARLMATVKQVRFTLEGIARGDYSLEHVLPLIEFGRKVIPSVKEEGERLVDAAKTLNPVEDFKSSPLLAPKLAAALPTTVSTLDQAISEVATIVDGLRKLAVTIAVGPSGGGAAAAEDSRPAVDDSRPARESARSRSGPGKRPAYEPDAIEAGDSLLSREGDAFRPEILTEWVRLSPIATLVRVRDGSSPEQIAEAIARRNPALELRWSGQRLVVRGLAFSALLGLLSEINVHEPLVEWAVEEILDQCGQRMDQSLCRSLGLSAAVLARCNPKECEARAQAGLERSALAATDACFEEKGEFACMELTNQNLSKPATRRVQELCLAGCRKKTAAIKEELSQRLESFVEVASRQCEQERDPSVCDRFDLGPAQMSQLGASLAIKSPARVASLGFDQRLFSSLRARCRATCNQRIEQARRAAAREPGAALDSVESRMRCVASTCIDCQRENLEKFGFDQTKCGDLFDACAVRCGCANDSGSLYEMCSD